jgi:hypothetical protein
MTIVVSVKVTDGIVLAADSAATFYVPWHNGTVTKIYNNANKIFNLRKLWPIGAVNYGAGGIGKVSAETLSKDLRRRFSDPDNADYHLDQNSYTIEEVAVKARRLFFQETYAAAALHDPMPDFYLGYRVCGYSANADLPEIWEFVIQGAACPAPQQVQARDEFGVRWEGQREALDRLFLGAPAGMEKWLVDKGLAKAEGARTLHLDFIKQFAAPLWLPAMPIQDAIDLAKFAVETAEKFARFGMQEETIGGPVEVAAITKHEGFKWIARKLYYRDELNADSHQ